MTEFAAPSNLRAFRVAKWKLPFRNRVKKTCGYTRTHIHTHTISLCDWEKKCTARLSWRGRRSSSASRDTRRFNYISHRGSVVSVYLNSRDISPVQMLSPTKARRKPRLRRTYVRRTQTPPRTRDSLSLVRNSSSFLLSFSLSLLRTPNSR